MKLRVLLFVLLIAACEEIPVPTGSPVEVECVSIQDTEPGLCRRMFEAVQAQYPAQVAAARRVLVVDTCPPRADCDRAFLHDAVVVVVPADDVDVGILAVHVTGNQGEPLRVAEWVGPLPGHVRRLLAG